MITPDPVLFSFRLYSSTPIVVTPWTFFGLVGNVLFTSRVIMQWVASERQKKSIAPVTFWWGSLAATIIMVFYSIQRIEIAFLLGYTINLVPYTRNLMLSYPKPRAWHIVSYSVAGLVFLGSLIFLILNAKAAMPWEQSAPAARIASNWIYLGLVSNILWSTRFIPQWIYSERKGRSVFPLWFWIWSLFGQLLCLSYALILHDLVYILGFLFNGIPIIRNIMLSKRGEAASH
jgi:lipid-A-disaccharide synthase-like uncharacterized protein